MHSTCLAQAQLYVTPKIGYVNAMLLFHPWHLAIIHLWVTLMETTHTLPKYQTRNSRWHPKFNSYNCNMSFVKLQRTQSLTRPTTHAAISTFSTSHNSISSQYSQSYSPRVLQHQTQTTFSMLQIKTIPKTHFDLQHLSTSSFYLYLPLKLSEGTNNT